jgi:hypothetical protein
MEAQRLRRRYDHRLQRLVHDTSDIQIAIRNGVPRSTARDWSRRPTSDVVSLDVTTMSESALQQEVIALRARNAKLIALLRLVVVLLRVCDVTLARRRLVDGVKKRRILDAGMFELRRAATFIARLLTALAALTASVVQKRHKGPAGSEA